MFREILSDVLDGSIIFTGHVLETGEVIACSASRQSCQVVCEQLSEMRTNIFWKNESSESSVYICVANAGSTSGRRFNLLISHFVYLSIFEEDD